MSCETKGRAGSFALLTFLNASTSFYECQVKETPEGQVHPVEGRREASGWNPLGRSREPPESLTSYARSPGPKPFASPFVRWDVILGDLRNSTVQFGVACMAGQGLRR